MQSRREFIQLATITAMLIGGKSWSSVAAKQEISENDLLKFDSKGQITLLHITDIHGQLKPVFFRPPSENFGIGKYEGIPPHLVGKVFLDYFGIEPNTQHVWIAANMSDRILRFNPEEETFMAYPSPTRVTFIRDFIFTYRRCV